MGSEMCIRDRQRIDRAPEVRLHLAATLLERIELGLEAMHELARLCLLYTSDAADERSSVDLGGRRIIKKKKSHSYGWMSVTH